MDAFDSTRAALRRCLVGGGRFTWVHEQGSPLAVTCWPYSQTMHAFALADMVSGPARFPGLAAGMTAYRDPRGGHRESIGPGHRYYDDNAWLGLAMLQRHAFSGGATARRRAADIDAFVRNGLDPDSGGILWVDGGDTLNACSTGAGALLHALLGGDIAPSLRFLEHLRDADGLVRDHVRADGSIEASVYSYNQGLLIAAAAASGHAALADEALEAGEAHFTADRLWSQPVAFNAVYCRAVLKHRRSAALDEYARRLAEEGHDDSGWATRAGRYDNTRVVDTAGALQIHALTRFPALVERSV
jgi:hypothetical protein